MLTKASELKLTELIPRAFVSSSMPEFPIVAYRILQSCGKSTMCNNVLCIANIHNSHQ